MNEPINFNELWEDVMRYDGHGSKKADFPGFRAQFYMGAMEIPLIAVFPKQPVTLNEEFIEQVSSFLPTFGLELDCVEDGGNYKLNTRETKLYVGRLTPDSLKLHAVRIREIGRDAFTEIVKAYLTGVTKKVTPVN